MVGLLPAMGAILSALLLSACIFESSEKNGGGHGSRLFVTTSDYLSGALLSFTLDSLKRGPDSLQINQDSRVLMQGGGVYVLERFGADNILKYDPVGGRAVYQKHLGDGWNPQDLIALNANTGFLSLLDHPQLLKIDLRNGNVLDSMDISGYSFVPGPGDSGSAATSPHAAGMARLGDTLFVALQRRNGDWRYPGGFSKVLMIRMSTFTLLDTLTAPGRNAGDIWVTGGNLFLSCPGKFYARDGALIRFDLAGGSSTPLITETDLDGDMVGFQCLGSACAVQVSRDTSYQPSNTVPVRLFDLNTGALGAQLAYAVDAFGGTAMNPATGVIFVGDRNPIGSGIHAYSAAGVKFLGPVSTGLPPSSLTIAEF